MFWGLTYGRAVAYKERVSKKKNPHAVALGRLGGKAAKGKKKARTSEQARAAVMVRWRNHRGKIK